jgi:hypothetical protein
LWVEFKCPANPLSDPREYKKNQKFVGLFAPTYVLDQFSIIFFQTFYPSLYTIHDIKLKKSEVWSAVRI